jgi:hypothetical protein
MIGLLEGSYRIKHTTIPFWNTVKLTQPTVIHLLEFSYHNVTHDIASSNTVKLTLPSAIRLSDGFFRKKTDGDTI